MQSQLNNQNDNSQKYIKIEKIAQGSYGIVYKARNKFTKQIFALKTFKNISKQGVPVSCIREINIMNSLESSPNLIRIIEVVQSKGLISMITQWMDFSLAELIKSANAYNVKYFLRSILKGIYAIHSLFIMHRDIKPSNIMIKKSIDSPQNYHIKIVDFGMAKADTFSNDELTNQVGSPYYRAPELLLGSKYYDYSVDIWAVGCIFYELISHQPLFKGNNELQQITAIFDVLGTPKLEDTKVYALFLEHFELGAQHQGKWAQKMQQINIDQKGIDLMKKMLQLQPFNRISAQEALKHEYFQ